MEGRTGNEPEFILLVEKGGGANGDGEEGDDLVVDASGANGDRSCRTYSFGNSVMCAGNGDEEVASHAWKGGRPSSSWNVRISSCAANKRSSSWASLGDK